jgi:hypothetical protein
MSSWGFIQLILLLSTSLIPVSHALEVLYRHFRHTHSKLDIPKSNIRFSKKGLIWALTRLLWVMKGAAITWALLGIIPTPNWLIPTTLILLSLHLVSPDTQAKSGLWWVIAGLYGILNPTFFWVFPLLSILLTLVINSWELGVLLALLTLFIFNFDLEQGYFIAIQGIAFGVTFLAWANPIFSHLEEKSHTLLQKFETR